MPKQRFQADGLFSLTFLCIMVAYLPALVRSIKARPDDKRSDHTHEFIWWLIKSNSLEKVFDAFSCRTFPLFPCSYQEHGGRSNDKHKWVYLMTYLAKSNSLKKVRDTSFGRIFPIWKQDKDWHIVHDGRQSSNRDLAKVMSTSLIPSSPIEWKLKGTITLLKVAKWSNASNG